MPLHEICTTFGTIQWLELPRDTQTSDCLDIHVLWIHVVAHHGCGLGRALVKRMERRVLTHAARARRRSRFRRSDAVASQSRPLRHVRFVVYDLTANTKSPASSFWDKMGYAPDRPDVSRNTKVRVVSL